MKNKKIFIAIALAGVVVITVTVIFFTNKKSVELPDSFNTTESAFLQSEQMYIDYIDSFIDLPYQNDDEQISVIDVNDNDGNYNDDNSIEKLIKQLEQMSASDFFGFLMGLSW